MRTSHDILMALCQLLEAMNTRKGCSAELHYNGMMCDFVLLFEYADIKHQFFSGSIEEIVDMAVVWWTNNSYKELPSVYD